MCVDIDLVLLLRERGCSPRQSDHLVQHGPGQGRRHGAGGEDREGPEEDSGGEQHQQQHGHQQEVEVGAARADVPRHLTLDKTSRRATQS